MDTITIRQGDQYSISFPILLAQHLLTTDLINSDDPELSGDIEIVVGKLRKTFKNGQIKFNTITYTFDFPLTQDETFALRPGTILASQIRVKLRVFNTTDNSTIYSYDGPSIKVLPSISKEYI